MINIDWHGRAKETSFRVRNFINGEYRDCKGINKVDKYSPRDGHLLYSFGEGDGSEVEMAVKSAKTAFDDGRWSGLSVRQRKTVLLKLADLIEEYKEEFALYECLDVGKPITHALEEDIPRSAARLRGAVEKADKLISPSVSDGAHFAYQRRKPIGVVGAIVGWNYPLTLATTKIGPALALGNTMVLKPSEFTSLSASRLAELAIEAGLPSGVLNIVHGTGGTVGAALSQHNDVDLLAFTGSSSTGKQLLISAGHSNMKRLIMECGGKSPYLVFDDCPSDLEFIAADIVETAFPNQGALCVAGTRLLIQESLKDDLLPKILEQAAKITPQDPLDSTTRFGALVNEAHLNKVLTYIESGVREGAELILDGRQIDVVAGGYYLGPTIFDQVSSKQKIAQEEIFGPVLSIITFKDEEEAIKLANDSCYGLSAYAATQSLGRAQRLGERLNSGSVFILGTSTPSGSVDIAAEKYRQSGFGFSGGMEGLYAYTANTAVHILT